MLYDFSEERMDNNPTNVSERPESAADSGATRYFPPQENYPANGPSAETPHSHQPQPAPNGNPYYNQQAIQTTPPAYQQYQQQPQSGRPHHWRGPWQGTDRDRTVLALILIGGGVLFLLGQLPFFPGFGSMVLLLIGGIFLYAYFSTRPGYRIGFLIPGAILLGIGAGQVLNNLPFPSLWGGDTTAVTLGLGFILIWLLERRHWWALIPGGIMVMSGLSTFAFFGALWPVALIALGVYLLYNQSRRPR
jgi:hypothetical protein